MVTRSPPSRRITNVYVHAPFCARRCCYCDFAVEVDRSPAGSRWLAAIGAELDTLRASGEAPLAPSLDTLYVGGGTPSLLEPRFIAGLAGVIGPGRVENPELEWTVEANPESFSERAAEVWAGGGVNRISFGVQSFDPGALNWMGRLHCAADARAAVQRARAAGVANLSVDLIFGLPDNVSRSWEDDVMRALELAVPHISLYGLTVEKGTPLHRAVGEGRAPMPADERYREEYLYAAETLTRAGYRHYEVSNFAFPGFASRHNRACWKGEPYLGLGNGAHSYHAGRRWWNERDWAVYAEGITKSGRARAGDEVPSAEQSRLEALWLRLRTAEGLNDDRLSAAARPVFRRWEVAGWARRSAGRTSLTPRGWLLLDELTVELETALGDPGTRHRGSRGGSVSAGDFAARARLPVHGGA
ncbi:MAG: radical SAM family heme chaperone HemW [Gemmatimonadota bacterium]|nr:radical SAM family heme chaperone HemW [Gemmatimonadota bacterium]